MPTPTLALTNRSLRAAVLALALVGVLGCGRRMCPVEGKVVFRDGAPFTKGMVVFESLEAENKVSALGEVQKDGTFRLGTHGENDGVPEGRYRVLIVPPMPTGERVGPWPIDPKYIRLDTSPLEYTVVQGKNEVTFEVDRPGASTRKAPQ